MCNGSRLSKVQWVKSSNYKFIHEKQTNGKVLIDQEIVQTFHRIFEKFDIKIVILN